MIAKEEIGICCPKCGGKSRVTDSRPGAANTIRRRRSCLKAGCSVRFTTYEFVGAEVGIGRGRLALAEDLEARIAAAASTLDKIGKDCGLAFEVLKGLSVNPRGGER